MVESVPAFLESVRRCQLLQPAQLELLEVRASGGMTDPYVLAMRLVKRGWLTLYQAERILEGEDEELVFGPFRVLNLLGEGGLCQVFRAWHTVREQMVALKVLHPELRNHPDVLRQFRQEMEILSRLEHPCFVKAIDVDLRRTSYYFAMDYVAGIDLGKLLRLAGPLPVPQACNYVAQAALGLQYAFEQGLVHRDVKPGNLVVTFEGNEVRILDIGLARLEWALGDTPVHGGRGGSALMGTADYIAPEQAVDPQLASIRADIYSLGCTLYHLLTGQPPFPGKSLAQKLIHHQQSPPPSARELRPGMPEELAKILRKAMAKAPAERFQTPAAFALALLPYTRGDEPEVSIEQFRDQCSPAERGPRRDTAGPGEATAVAADTTNLQAALAAGDVPPPPSYEELRSTLRRSGNPVSVQVFDELNMQEPLSGWVINRSLGGLCLLVDEPLELHSVVGVRPNLPGLDPPWIQFKIVYCQPERASWRVGGSFVEKLSWRELRLFG